MPDDLHENVHIEILRITGLPSDGPPSVLDTMAGGYFRCGTLTRFWDERENQKEHRDTS